VIVSYETIRCWCDKFGASFACRVKAARRKPGNTWPLTKCSSHCAANLICCGVRSMSTGAELDILLQKRGDKAAAKRFSGECYARARCRARSSPISCAAIRRPKPRSRNLRTLSACSSCSPAERPRREQPPTDARTRASHARLSRPGTHTEFLSCLGPIRQHLALKRHLLRASLYRKQLAARFVAWREFAEVTPNPVAAF
jgi:putative transposase